MHEDVSCVNSQMKKIQTGDVEILNKFQTKIGILSKSKRQQKKKKQSEEKVILPL